MRLLLVVVFCGVTPGLATAQTAPPTLPTNEIHLSLGWAGAEHGIPDQRRWHGSVLPGVSVGHYWTDHLKTEIEAGWSNPRTHQLYENIERDGGYTYALSDYRARDIRMGVAQLYQFGRNQWVHPYVGVGVDVVHRKTTLERLPQSRTLFLQNRSISIDIPAANEHTTTVFAQGILKTGVKMYAGEHTFFSTELKLGLRRDVDHIVWRFGFGVDY